MSLRLDYELEDQKEFVSEFAAKDLQNFEAIKAHILVRRPRTVFLEVQDLHFARCGGMGTTSALTGRHQEDER